MAKYKTMFSAAHQKELFYDIIGDVHGYSSELISLLKKMDYTCVNDTWSHPQRIAVFVGDFICRGNDSRGVLSIVNNMVKSGTGLAVLGNHEINAIGYFTHSKSGNPICNSLSESGKKSMENIRKQFKKEPELLDFYIKWLRKLPLFLDLGKIRIAHAYWNANHHKTITKNITKGKLTKQLLKEIFNGKSEFAIAVTQTTKGVTLKLPKDLIVKDRKGTIHKNIRLKWWEEPHGKTFREMSYCRYILPDYTVPKQIIPNFRIYDENEPLFFFGHYCINYDEATPRKNICCVNNCVAGLSRLAAYRWSGEESVKMENFVFEKIHS